MQLIACRFQFISVEAVNAEQNRCEMNSIVEYRKGNSMEMKQELSDFFLNIFLSF